MARIDISEPYEQYLKKQVEAGYFRSITAAAEHAILIQMKEENLLSNKRNLALIKEGEDDIKLSKTITYSPSMMKEITKKVKE